MFIVATNVVASRPPERRPIRTLHAHANTSLCESVCSKLGTSSDGSKIVSYSFCDNECVSPSYFSSLCAPSLSFCLFVCLFYESMFPTLCFRFFICFFLASCFPILLRGSIWVAKICVQFQSLNNHNLVRLFMWESLNITLTLDLQSI